MTPYFCNNESSSNMKVSALFVEGSKDEKISAKKYEKFNLSNSYNYFICV
jgi:hypothetical protein